MPARTVYTELDMHINQHPIAIPNWELVCQPLIRRQGANGILFWLQAPV